MCGITAYISRQGADLSILKKMTNSIVHRGPDDFGAWISRNQQVALGQRRLSIVDLTERGHQPMQSTNKGAVITYNGEVYNFKELRVGLEKRGFVFSSQTDTEVILNLLYDMGETAISLLNGMWGLVFYNENENKVIVSRDPVGIKPIYYFWDGDTLLLASEVKAILASGLVRAELDHEGMGEYFTFQNIISDKTLFKNIKMLPAGSNLIWDLNTGKFQIQKYWDFEFYKPQRVYSENYYIEKLNYEFEEAIKRHIISDVPVGATISGGMDSSAIVSVATKYLPQMQTFNGYFDTSANLVGDRSYSEFDDALLISKVFGTKHNSRRISWEDQQQAMPLIVWHLEDPKVGMCYPFYCISQLVSSKVTVSLSGSGGDEIFAGYPWRYNVVDGITDSDRFCSVYYDYWSRVVKKDNQKKFFSENSLKKFSIDRSFEVFCSVLSSAKADTPINKALYFEAKTFLHGMLMVEDKMGMAFSLETRFPFLDKRLIEFAQTIPDQYKFNNNQGKRLFRKAFAQSLPAEIVNKKKQGFTPPDYTFYKKELNSWVRDMLLGHRTMCHEYIDRSQISKLIQSHEAGNDERFAIWSLLFFEGWCRTFLAQKEIPSVRLY